MANTDLHDKLHRARQNARDRYREAEAEAERCSADAALAARAGSRGVGAYLDKGLLAQSAAAANLAVVTLLDALLATD
jgi:hypothetical protein